MVDQLLHDLGISFPVVAFQAAVFIVVFLVMRRLLFEQTHAFMQARDKEVEETRRKIAEERDQVEALVAQYEQKLAAIEKEANEKLQQIVREGVATRAKILQEAHEQAQRELQEARRRIGAAKQEALAQLRGELARLSIETVEKVVGHPVEPGAYRSLIEAALAELDRRGGAP